MSKKKEYLLPICFILLSIYFLIQGINHPIGIGRIGYLLCTIGSFMGSMGFLIKGLNKREKNRRVINF